MSEKVITREEQYLSAIAGEGTANIKPITRKEMFLAKAAGQSVPDIEPITREEFLLKKIADNGTSGGSGGGVPNISKVETVTSSISLRDFSQLGRLEFPNATSIGENAFANCYNLASVSIPNVESIDSNAFLNCGLREVYYVSNISIGENAFAGNENLKCLRSGESRTPCVEYLGAYAFANCTSLEYVDGIGHCPAVPDGAFMNCYAFDFSVYPRATSIGESAFAECISLTSILAEKVENVMPNAFVQCVSLWYVVLSLAKNIGESAFAGCESLTHIDIHSAVSIGGHAFGQCTSLTSVDLPNATSIGEGAFERCTSLETVDLGGATRIDRRAFAGCMALRNLILRTAETVCVIDLNAFNETLILLNPNTGLNEGNIYVPTIMYEYYRAGYEETLNGMLGEGAFDRILRKIEDYPEITG